MSGAYNLPDYREKHFVYKTLTKIFGQPTIDGIVQLFTEVKRNAQTVKCALGGGQFGYLALAITTPDFNAIPGTLPFERPEHPGEFDPSTLPTVTGVTTRAAAAAAEEDAEEPTAAESWHEN